MILIINLFFSYTETDQEEEATSSKRKTVLDKKEIISISDNSELAYSLGLEDEQGTFSILQYSADESNDGQEHGLNLNLIFSLKFLCFPLKQSAKEIKILYFQGL